MYPMKRVTRPKAKKVTPYRKLSKTKRTALKAGSAIQRAMTPKRKSAASKAAKTATMAASRSRTRSMLKRGAAKKRTSRKSSLPPLLTK